MKLVAAIMAGLVCAGAAAGLGPRWRVVAQTTFTSRCFAPTPQYRCTNLPDVLVVHPKKIAVRSAGRHVRQTLIKWQCFPNLGPQHHATYDRAGFFPLAHVKGHYCDVSAVALSTTGKVTLQVLR